MSGVRQAWTDPAGVCYAPGARFRVLRPMRLTGWVPGSGCVDGWGQQLRPGDIITCTGYGPGLGADPGCGVEWTTPEADAAHAVHCDTSPSAGGAFGYRPPAGYVGFCEGLAGAGVLTGKQRAVLRALARQPGADTFWVSGVTGQSFGGVMRTLRSLADRRLVAMGYLTGDVAMPGWLLTAAGWAAAGSLKEAGNGAVVG